MSAVIDAMRAEYEALSDSEKQKFNLTYQDFTDAVAKDNEISREMQAGNLAEFAQEKIPETAKYFTDAKNRLDAGTYSEEAALKETANGVKVNYEDTAGLSRQGQERYMAALSGGLFKEPQADTANPQPSALHREEITKTLEATEKDIGGDTAPLPSTEENIGATVTPLNEEKAPRSGATIKAEYEQLSADNQTKFNTSFQEFTVAVKDNDKAAAMAKADEIAGIAPEGSDIKEYFTDASTRIEAGQYVERDMIVAKFAGESDFTGPQKAEQGKARFESILSDDPSVSEKAVEQQVASATSAEPVQTAQSGRDAILAQARNDSSLSQSVVPPNPDLEVPTMQAPALSEQDREAARDFVPEGDLRDSTAVDFEAVTDNNSTPNSQQPEEMATDFRAVGDEAPQDAPGQGANNFIPVGEDGRLQSNPELEVPAMQAPVPLEQDTERAESFVPQGDSRDNEAAAFEPVTQSKATSPNPDAPAQEAAADFRAVGDEAQQDAPGQGAADFVPVSEESPVTGTEPIMDNSNEQVQGEVKTGETPANENTPEQPEITQENKDKTPAQAAPTVDPNTIIINEQDAQRIASNLNDGKAVNDSATLGELGVNAKQGAYTEKDFSKAIAERARGGFTQADLDEIRGMSVADKDGNGKADNIKDSEKGQNYKQEIALGEIQAPTINGNQPEAGQAATR